MWIFIVVGIVFIIFLYVVIKYNKLNKASIKVEEAFSGIDVALTKRYDVLTKMVEVVKGYTKYENETLTKVISIRSGMSLEEKEEANKSMDESFNKINLTKENYPNLKADNNFQMLEKAVIDVEEHLQAARRLYNSNVSLYNQLLVVFPTNLIAKFFKMSKKDFFEADKTTENYNIEVK